MRIAKGIVNGWCGACWCGANAALRRDDATDALRYLLATKSRTLSTVKLRGL
jgi:hypothetical protein